MSDYVNYRELMVAKALTKEELDQEAVLAEQFEHWWDAEGQYHRAGGNDYCKTFAWWAWLNQEKSKQAKIDELQKRVDEFEQAIKHLSDMSNKSISYEHDLFDKGWNQCARQTVENIYRLTGIGIMNDQHLTR